MSSTASRWTSRALWTRAGAFSGGNQQKIAIAKWLLAESRILLLFDPTRGIDVGTKHELYRLMRDFADAGGAVLFHSTEIPELVISATGCWSSMTAAWPRSIAAERLSEEAIMRAALGACPGAGVGRMSTAAAGASGLAPRSGTPDARLRQLGRHRGS